MAGFFWIGNVLRLAGFLHASRAAAVFQPFLAGLFMATWKKKDGFAWQEAEAASAVQNATATRADRFTRTYTSQPAPPGA